MIVASICFHKHQKDALKLDTFSIAASSDVKDAFAAAAETDETFTPPEPVPCSFQEKPTQNQFCYLQLILQQHHLVSLMAPPSDVRVIKPRAIAAVLLQSVIVESILDRLSLL